MEFDVKTDQLKLKNVVRPSRYNPYGNIPFTLISSKILFRPTQGTATSKPTLML